MKISQFTVLTDVHSMGLIQQAFFFIMLVEKAWQYDVMFMRFPREYTDTRTHSKYTNMNPQNKANHAFSVFCSGKELNCKVDWVSLEQAHGCYPFCAQSSKTSTYNC